jgi:hypothetical protein
MSIKAKMATNQMMIDRLAAQSKVVEAAREHGIKDKAFSFTRRTLAIGSVFAVIVLPKLAALLAPETLVTVGYTEWQPGFWFLVDGSDEIKWRVATGLTITPLDTHFVSAVAGLYFGSSIVKNA